jgi:DNA-3-methyladenine glycosylase
MTSTVRGGGGGSGSPASEPDVPGGADGQPGDAERCEVLPRGFFGRPVLTVAPALLGCILAHQTEAGLVAAQIVEVEAYRGESDPASHAFRGKTARNAVMFGEPGHAYVYFTYGMHFCVNLVCQQPGEPAAVLLRAARVLEGAGLAATRRGVGWRPGGARGAAGGSRDPAGGRGAAAERDLARGPARLCQALGIDRAQNGADVCDQAGALRVLAPPGFRGLPDAAISTGPRVGVRLGAEDPWRFWVAGDPAVSVYRPHLPKRRIPPA